MIYLASPYSHPDSTIRRWRSEQAAKAVRILARQGIAAFAPVPYSIDVLGEETFLSHKQWLDCDFAFLRRCDEMVILDLPGWEKSEGIKAELREAKRYGLVVSVWNMTEPFEERVFVHPLGSRTWDEMPEEGKR